MKDERNVHWSRQKEKTAGYWPLKLLLSLFNILPVLIIRILAFAVGLFYFLFSKSTRVESKRFLTRAVSFAVNANEAKRCRSLLGPLRHIISFSLTVVEKLQSWGKKFSFKNIHFQDDDIKELIEGLEKGKGAFLICSHLGNAELLRGLASFDHTGVSRSVPVISILNVDVTAQFFRMLKELNPQSSMNIISANAINPDTAFLLEETLASGGLAVIAGDRTPLKNSKQASVNETTDNLKISFLGEEALFPIGAFYLAVLMKAPVYFVFALRRGTLALKPEYDMHVHKGVFSHDCSRKERVLQSSNLARSFASYLERYCKEKPFQWYNFFDFWSKEV